MSVNSITLLLTGSTGFLGAALLQHFSADKSYSVISVARTRHVVPEGVALEVVGDFDQSTQWRSVFRHPVDVVVHAAARAHVLSDTAQDPLSQYRRVNVAGTLSLARSAAAAGVKRFVFISSIKVNGDATPAGKAFGPADPVRPDSDYGLSKLEAERGLLDIQKATGMEVVIIRPVLIYGPGVKANFLSMMRWLNRGVPLPLGAIHNARSLLALGNAVDFIALCVSHPKAANEVFLLSDGDDVSTTVLLRELAHSLGKRAKLIPFPHTLLIRVAALLGRAGQAQRLLGSLRVDTEKNARVLGWRAPISRKDALDATAQHFLSSESR